MKEEMYMEIAMGFFVLVLSLACMAMGLMYVMTN